MTAVFFTLTIYGWLFFRITDLSYLWHLNATLWNVSKWSVGTMHSLGVLSQIAVYIVPLVVFERIQRSANDTEIVTKQHWAVQMAIAGALIVACVIFAVESNAAFIYFQF